MLDKMKMFMEMQKKMQEVKKHLDSTTFEVESSSRAVRVTMNGSQEVKAVAIQMDPATARRSDLEEAIMDACNKAIKRSQTIAAEKMKDVTGMNLPGLT